MKQAAKYIRWFEEIKIEDVPVAGRKNASLGEMYREVSQEGIKIPNGFATTSDACWHTVNVAGVLDKLKQAIAGLDESKVTDLAVRGKRLAI